MADVRGAFAEALIQRDIIPPDPLIADGRMHRCDAAGKNGKGDAAYLLHLDNFPAGGFENHRDGLGWSNWKAPTDRQFTAAEKAAHRSRLESIKREREADDQKRREEAAEVAKSIWRDAKPAPADHPYLVRKGIQAHGLRQHEGRLVIPLRDGEALLCSLQFIDANGDKRFLPNGRTRGRYFAIGQPAATLCVAEGYATAAAVHEATGHAVAVAFNANNIEPVAVALRAKFPEARLIVCADDDHGSEGNPGLSRANAAAKAVGGFVAVPEFGAERPDIATDFNDLLKHGGVQAVRDCIERARPVEHEAATVDEQPDGHRNAPRPDPKCLYGLVGEVALAGSATTEANAFAIALNFLVYLGVAVGRGCFMSVGDTWHHPRIFGLHVGRSGRGRKGDAVSLIQRIDMAVRAKEPTLAPQTHGGGLSTREGLVLMIHDGFKEGKSEVEPVLDKRLWIAESEFANVLHQSKRDGNTLSAALRDAWDGKTIKPATKTFRIGATDPHIGLSAAITPSELRDLIAKRELSNGFANRFLVIWSEREKLVPFPQATPQDHVNVLADRVVDVLRFAGAHRPADCDKHRITLSSTAQGLYARLYRGELNAPDGGTLVTSLIERRAPVLLRLAMLFALCDLQHEVDVPHVEAALAWVRYWSESARFVFASANDEAHAAQVNETAERIVDFLKNRPKATRTEISRDCLSGHSSSDEIDSALDELLTANPPAIVVESVPRRKGNPGAPTKFYKLTANCAKPANCEDSCDSSSDLADANSCEVSELSPTLFRTIRTLRNGGECPETRSDTHNSHNSHISHVSNETAAPIRETF